MGNDTIIHSSDLHYRNRWLQDNAQEIAPYLSKGLACIVFTFSRQEPIDRMTTRIGGLPYWPRSQPWPVCRHCRQPLSFAAQLDCRDPRIRPGVPGDGLIFHYCFDCPGAWSSEDPARNGGWSLVWQQALAPEELILPADLPTVAKVSLVGPFYGEPQDAVDYPTPPEAYDGEIAGEEYTSSYFTLQGTKLGGYPPPIQEFETPVDAAGCPMHFIGTLGSVQSDAVDLNHEAQGQGDLAWGDMGSIYVWLSDDRTQTRWFLECY